MGQSRPREAVRIFAVVDFETGEEQVRLVEKQSEINSLNGDKLEKNKDGIKSLPKRIVDEIVSEYKDAIEWDYVWNLAEDSADLEIEGVSEIQVLVGHVSLT